MRQPRTPRHFPRMKVRGARRRELAADHRLGRFMDQVMPSWEQWNVTSRPRQAGKRRSAELAHAFVTISPSVREFTDALADVGEAAATAGSGLERFTAAVSDPGSDEYLVLLGLDHPPVSATCPGAFLWSAYGATYPDTECVGGTLGDADRGFLSSESIPCPMHQPGAFWEHTYGGLYYQPVCQRCDQGIATGTPILFHEIGHGLRMSAHCNACRKPTWITAREPVRFADEIPPYEYPDAA